MARYHVETSAFSPSAEFRSGAQMPAGALGHFLNCASNPYDLRPAADLILDVTKNLARDATPARPLVLVMTEVHTTPSHLELQHLVAKRLHQSSAALQVNVEYPRNLWAVMARENMSHRIPDALYHDCAQYDPLSKASITAALGYCNVGPAPTAFANQLEFYLRHDVNFAFNDAALYGNGLDMTDDLNIKLAQLHYLEAHGKKQAPTYIRDEYGDGLAIRNRTMVQLALSQARQTGSNIIVQGAGQNHVLGNEHENDDYAYSLTALFKKSGAIVVPIFLTTSQDDCGLNILPAASYAELRHGIVIDGLAQEEFSRAKGNYEQEPAFLRRLHAANGGELELIADLINREPYRELAQRYSEDVLARYAAANGLPAPAKP